MKNTGPITLPDFQVFVTNPTFWDLVNRHRSRKEANSLSTTLVFLYGWWTWQMFVSCFFLQGIFISKENFQGILQGFFISKETLTYNFILGVLMEKGYIPMQGHRSQRLISGVFLYHDHHIFWDRVFSWAKSSAIGQLQLLLSPSPVPETIAMHHCPFHWRGYWVAECSCPNLHRKQLTHWPPHQPILRRGVCFCGLQTLQRTFILSLHWQPLEIRNTDHFESFNIPVPLPVLSHFSSSSYPERIKPHPVSPTYIHCREQGCTSSFSQNSLQQKSFDFFSL